MDACPSLRASTRAAPQPRGPTDTLLASINLPQSRSRVPELQPAYFPTHSHFAEDAFFGVSFSISFLQRWVAAFSSVICW